jgi:hemolysin activation/secretion protein
LPGISTKVSLQAGREPGTTDVLASLQATELVQGAATFDNQGSRNTGEERLNAQFQVNSYFGGGEQFAVAVSKTQGSEFMRLGVKFPIALPSWRGLSMELSQSRLNYKVLRSMWGEDAEVAPQGFSNTGGFGFSYPLIRSSSGNITLTLEREHRDSEDKSDEYSVDRGDLTAFRATDAQVDQFAIASNFSDLWMGGGNNVVNLTIYNGRVDLLAHTAILDESLQRDLEGLNTSGSFKKQRLTVSRLQYLSARNSLFVTATSQWANKNLDSSEKFYLGGPNGVRAYPASEIGGSEGLLTSIEWRHALTERWQLGLFYDYGRVRQLVHTLSPTGDTLISDGDTNIHKIKGRGLSAAYTHPNGMQFKATVSRRIGANPAPTEDGTDKDGTLRMNRWWFTASIPF